MRPDEVRPLSAEEIEGASGGIAPAIAMAAVATYVAYKYWSERMK